MGHASSTTSFHIKTSYWGKLFSGITSVIISLSFFFRGSTAQSPSSSYSILWCVFGVHPSVCVCVCSVCGVCVCVLCRFLSCFQTCTELQRSSGLSPSGPCVCEVHRNSRESGVHVRRSRRSSAGFTGSERGGGDTSDTGQTQRIKNTKTRRRRWRGCDESVWWYGPTPVWMFCKQKHVTSAAGLTCDFLPLPAAAPPPPPPPSPESC